MPAEEACEVRPLPSGVRRADGARMTWNPFPAILVRCRSQKPDDVPLYARSRFLPGSREISGAFGDLGTFIPHIVGAISVVGMAPTGIFLSFGLFYLFSGIFYGLPIPVQPMKAASAVLLTQTLSPGAMAGTGLTVGIILVVLGMTGAISRLARVLPATVAAGLQLGLGLALAWLGAKMMMATPWLAILTCALLLVLIRSRWLPGVPIALVVGVIAGQAAGLVPPLPDLAFGLHLPGLVLPSPAEIGEGFLSATVPQLPLTITNAVIVTAALTRQLFPREIHRVTETNLCLTSGVANILTAPFGGYPMCHGAGGLAAHHRFGARSATAPTIIGVLFVGCAVLLGDQAFALVQTIPEAALGALLAFSGLDLVRSSKPRRFAPTQIGVLAVIAGASFAVNPALGFAVGWPLATIAERVTKAAATRPHP